MQRFHPCDRAALDAYSHELARASPFPAVAARDLGRLASLAKHVVDDVTGWSERVQALDCSAAFNIDRAILLILETVFDDVMTPEGLAVLRAEMNLLVNAA